MSLVETAGKCGFGISHDKRARLRDMKMFILDNSLRESTVAQKKGHTLDNKFEILKQIQKCGFDNVIVGAFGSLSDRRVDDVFCENLDEHMKNAKISDAWTYAFTEVSDNVHFVDGQMKLGYGEKCVPAGMQKMKEYGISSAIIEIDVYTTKSVPMPEVVEVFTYLLTWANANFKKLNDATLRRRHMVNLRDLPVAMLQCPQRVLDLVEAIAKLPKDIRPSGMIFEEPLGEYFGEEVANWTSAIRKVMDDNDWKSEWQCNGCTVDGVLLYHTHEQYGLADATNLDALAAGADGMWCGLSKEGAPMGHACSAVALTNLARLGNEHVVKKYKTQNLVSAARIVSSATTGEPVPFNQVVYGAGAVDECFSFGSIAQGKRATDVDYDGNGVLNKLDLFSVAGLIGIKDPPVRISTLASASLVTKRLTQCFGENVLFTDDRSQKLLVEIKRRLANNIKEEYCQPDQLGQLWNDTFPDDGIEWVIN